MRILATKKLLISGLAALSLVLAGCLTNDDDEDGAPAITTHPQSQTIDAGDTLTLSVVATGDATLKYTWIMTLDGMVDTLSDTTATIVGDGLDVDFNGASIVCVVSNSKGSVTSNPAVITVNGLAWPDTGVVRTLGAQAHATVGSVIDLDSNKVWTSATANANQAKIDLVYLYYNGAASLNGASAARDSGIKYVINLTNSYNAAQVKNIKLVKVTAKPATQNHARLAYEDGNQVRATPVVAGDKFVVLTSENKYMYLEVTTVTGTTAGTAALKVNIGSLAP